MNTLIAKIVAAALGLTCTMILAVTGKIDGPTAMSAVTWMVSTFLVGAAVLGTGQAISKAVTSSQPASTETVTKVVNAVLAAKGKQS